MLIDAPNIATDSEGGEDATEVAITQENAATLLQQINDLSR